jgi:hypothetical protein
VNVEWVDEAFVHVLVLLVVVPLTRLDVVEPIERFMRNWEPHDFTFSLNVDLEFGVEYVDSFSILIF